MLPCRNTIAFCLNAMVQLSALQNMAPPQAATFSKKDTVEVPANSIIVLHHPCF